MPDTGPSSDVLIAVRRLVDGATVRDVAPLAQPAPLVLGADMIVAPLMLTPAQRVDDDMAAESLPELQPQPEPEQAAVVSIGPFSGRAPQFGAGEEEGAVSPPSVSASLTISEDSLRELIAEVLRTELQGELGERITSNVRKLVRREVLRSLNARDNE
ncbi:glycerol-3-phosphate dehydrogenase [Ketogulonicigenium vulgare]|uniref:Glycerol-3-phosphate dehydrogenase n=1 Tax=Ketogulonicigenium vulgare (strain WSH-001) TaxID=759362 RepID=F9Y875_KETVW|nr:glycerol-3-phosphate dehydrogenase [Ketogulonicigenium vulgare]AEM42361.1 Glycerol-3-phosphate dehydrogenase [Ketogulonicigenium vulgare WSH-001]ALJ79985.1 glycerol-3-phosphate dehydrogenase [Ketogulonicigenium vulgare]ANW32875.1 glycerol-3-phosphate dehydrogenase [Ketogulonicigenium vulgare]AOZ53445.1 Glycerol-3-phosphate dehydrogenase [Ketogulonicigenium vulgare]